jgi:hypothetical protein
MATGWSRPSGLRSGCKKVAASAAEVNLKPEHKLKLGGE